MHKKTRIIFKLLPQLLAGDSDNAQAGVIHVWRRYFQISQLLKTADIFEKMHFLHAIISKGNFQRLKVLHKKQQNTELNNICRLILQKTYIVNRN